MLFVIMNKKYILKLSLVALSKFNLSVVETRNTPILNNSDIAAEKIGF